MFRLNLNNLKRLRQYEISIRIMKKVDKPKKRRKAATQEAPEQLYGLTAVLVIVFTWLVLTSIVGGETTHLFLMIGVVLGLIYCINKLLSFGIKIEGVKDWVKVYYSLPTYMRCGRNSASKTRPQTSVPCSRIRP